ncbi:MAG TPA: hypothetical protein VKB80_10505 [Kofleriaceae bacterium]|nr:hypothetical protein [Kofleriaceae bacterium]
MGSGPGANRRDVLRLVAGAGLAPVLGGCGGGMSGILCQPIPRETAGPFPGDGSNGANALALPGIVRGDIRSSIAGASATAEGVPLTLRLVLLDAGGDCAPLAGRAVYVWHCDREGRYSMYSGGVTGENYLRGVQESDEGGTVSFTTIFPGCYPGRMPHIHFTVYESLAAASAPPPAAALLTSQLAFPVDACNQVYALPGYEPSRDALAPMSFERDGVFREGVSLQLAGMSGAADDELVATLEVAVAS